MDNVEKYLAEVEGWLWEEEGVKLLELAQAVPQELEIVELGSHQGRSSCYLAEGSRTGNGAHITCIDIWKDDDAEDPEWAMKEFISNVAGGGWEDLITSIQSMTSSAATTWTKPIGLLFIDANHYYHHITEDIICWSPFVVHQGMMVFHDDMKDWPGVMQAINELVVPQAEWEDLGRIGRNGLRMFRRGGAEGGIQ